MGLLLHEHHLVLVEPQASEVTVVRPVEELATLVGGPACEYDPLVIAIKVHLEGLVACAVALQQLVLDVRGASGRHQGRHPVLRRDDIVDLRSRLDETGPTHQGRHPVAAFPVGVLLAPEWRRATVRPSECLGAVVGRVDDDRVVGDAEVVELLQELPNLTIMLHHAVGINAKTCLSLRTLA